jgi:hypothetical protein
MVVEGGTAAAVAQAIYGARGIGCFTNGTTTVPVADPNSGYTMDISFFLPTYLPVAILLTLTPLSGYTSATTAAIQAALVSYLNSLSIGETVVFSELYGAALTARPNPDQPLFSITALSSGAQAANPTAALTATNHVVVVSSNTGIVVGQFVVDETTPGNILPGTTVTVIAGTSITLSTAAQGTAAADSLAFFTMSTVDIPMPHTYNVAQGAAANIQVTT